MNVSKATDASLPVTKASKVTDALLDRIAEQRDMIIYLNLALQNTPDTEGTQP